ncbi:MAG: iron complex outermembrane receptor protein [Gammaproteobacteria bacterium]|jgi:iron complex outermembrane receptor protein
MSFKTLISCTLALVFATPVFAQSALEEVVVTAQRREQSLQEVPVSVTAFTGATIEQANITSARDYLALTPNVAFTDDGQTGSKGVGIAIRGVGNLVSGENAAVNSVGVYLDGFSIASVPNQVANPALPDMQSIEVLRGPQGTFFGRNSVGGALNLRSAEPTDEFGYKLTVGGESYDGANEMGNVTAVVNAPLSDTFRVRGLLSYEDSGGRVKNACRTGASAAECPNAAFNNFTPNGAKDSGYEEITARLKASWDMSEDTTVGLTFIYSDSDQGHDENIPSGILDVDTVDTLGLSDAIDPGTGFFPNNQNTLSHDVAEFNKNEAIITILNVQHRINDNMKLTSISGFIDAENTRLFDQDLVGGVDTLDRTNKYTGFSWSTELRLDYSGESVDWTVGVMYAKDDQEQENKVGISTNATALINGTTGWLPPFPQGLGLAFNEKNFEVENKSIFADMTFHMTDTLDLIAGGRFSADQVNKGLAAQGIGPGPICFNDPACLVFLGGVGGPTATFFPSFVNSPRPVSNAEADFTDFSPRFGARFQVTDDVNIYAMVSKGYKPGGHSVGNQTNTDGAPAFNSPYGKETLWNYELGFKAELLDNRLRLNASIFHLEWKDLQFESFFFLTPGELSTNFEQTINIPDAEADGIEVEFVAIVTDNFTLSGGFGYISTEITSQQTVELSGGWRPELQGLGLPKAPELTANLVGEYRWPMGNNEAWVRLEFIHRDGQYSDIEGLVNQQLNGQSPNSIAAQAAALAAGNSIPGPQFHNSGPGQFPYLSPDYDLLNIRAGFEMGDFTISGFVENLTDEKYYTGTQENFGVSGIRLRPNPLTFGGSVSYSFGGI